ncbi:patanin-like phospholipase domain-containing protein atgl-1 isoform X1 [Tribolium castaneum]|uniref:patanin-like phospholipase domain-containing protein atgl-1 isoform X1 n=1 Tax=Tribolium castaneum TaxID=7070 RepID=UPI0000D55CEA|nr:PREDICTED: patanin-like phospholipase domain-containing protein isoform X1 [Tribolium castaneum]|eukprot:XP_008191795.1 PREDICTED: patanin-like phospholipase domain-containing protein isoform X1 [Tribolium castaneum]
MNLSFAGCGFLGIYHVGVACCFRKYAPHLLLNKISGASAGAIAACCLLLDLPLGETTSDILRVATEARRRSLGPFNPSFNIHSLLLEGLEKFLPDDAHIRVSGKLHISLTRVHDGKNVIVSQFDSREELIQALLATAFIPIFSGIIPPKFKGVRYMDGGYSDNLPTLDENTITVSPFCGESDICPRDDSSQLFHINIANTSIELSKHNIYRIMRILFPPNPEVLSNMCKQGFDDALRFLHRNNLINCTRCLAVQSTFVVSDTLEENLEYDPQCKECKQHRQEALVSNMPDTVLSIFQEAIDSANNGLLNWVFKHRGMKLLSVLSLPYTLPADMMYATFTKLGVIPAVKKAPMVISRTVTDFNFMSAVGSHFETRSFRFRNLRTPAIETNVLMPCSACSHLNNERRLMAAAPQVGNTVWDVSKYFMDQLSHLLNKVNKKREQISAKIICQLAVTEYGGRDVEACQDALSTKNKMNLNFTLNLDDSDLPLTQSPGRKFATTKILQRKPSLTINRTDTGDDDTFEHILQVTSHHETIMAYYYLDENNKVKVTEIFDVTESDSPIVQSSHEKEFNKSLEFDDDWDESTWTTTHALDDQMYLDERRKSLAEMSEYSLEDLLDKDTSNLFSDPESEWTGTYRIEEPEDEDEMPTADLRPESDQPSYLRTTTIPSFTFHEES